VRFEQKGGLCAELLIRNVRNVHPSMKPGMSGIYTTLRTVPSQTGLLEGLPFVYPIVHVSHPEELSNSAHHLPSTLTPLRTLASLSPPTQGFLLRLSPGPLSHTTDEQVGDVQTDVHWWDIQGCTWEG